MRQNYCKHSSIYTASIFKKNYLEAGFIIYTLWLHGLCSVFLGNLLQVALLWFYFWNPADIYYSNKTINVCFLSKATANAPGMFAF